MARFVHLRVHTEYSLVDGVVRIESERKDGKLTAVITDIVNPNDVTTAAGADAVRTGALARFNSATWSRKSRPPGYRCSLRR